MKKALIRNSDNVVVNVINVDTSIPAPKEGEPDKRYSPPSGYRLVDIKPGARAGNVYADGKFSESQAQKDKKAAEEAKRRAARPAEVKQEAYRRIIAIFPEWKQRNMTAEGVELLVKLADGGKLTTEEQATRTRNLAAWAQVKAIRDKSDALEAMNPIPDDFAHDKYWT